MLKGILTFYLSIAILLISVEAPLLYLFDNENHQEEIVNPSEQDNNKESQEEESNGSRDSESNSESSEVWCNSTLSGYSFGTLVLGRILIESMNISFTTSGHLLILTPPPEVCFLDFS